MVQNRPLSASPHRFQQRGDLSARFVRHEQSRAVKAPLHVLCLQQIVRIGGVISSSLYGLGLRERMGNKQNLRLDDARANRIANFAQSVLCTVGTVIRLALLGQAFRRQVVCRFGRFGQCGQKVFQTGLRNDDAVGISAVPLDDADESPTGILLEQKHERFALDLNLFGAEGAFVPSWSWRGLLMGKL